MLAGDVQANFARYGLLDDQVRFLKGWFRDTLPTLRRALAVMRLDGDMYESTMDAPREPLPEAVAGRLRDHRRLRRAAGTASRPSTTTAPTHGIDDDPTVDWTGAYWRKT